MATPTSTCARCPGCDQPGLRAFADRLACDACGALTMSGRDFADSLRELDASTSELEVASGALAGRSCPRCAAELHAAELRFGKTALHGGFLVCAADGAIFAPQAALLDSLERVSRAGGARGVGGGPALAGRSGTAGAAAAGIRDAFGSHLVTHQGSARTAPKTPFATAYHGQPLVCPVDERPLAVADARWTCTTCHGAFVEDAALVELVGEMTGHPWELPRPTGSPTDTACPVCRALMTGEKIEGAHAARCVHHGVWLADGALGELLAHASAPKKRGLLARLFGR